MDHIAGLLQKVLKKRGLETHAEASLLIFQAQGWIQSHYQQLHDSIIATVFKDGTLTICTAHSIAAQSIAEKKEDLLAYLQKECGHRDLRDIRIVRQ